MKKRYFILHQLLEKFLCGAQGGSYGKRTLPLVLGLLCSVPLVFAALFHFLGAFWGCATAAVLAALALAHFDAYESEYPAEPEAPACQKPACVPYRKQRRLCSKKNAS